MRLEDVRRKQHKQDQLDAGLRGPAAAHPEKQKLQQEQTPKLAILLEDGEPCEETEPKGAPGLATRDFNIKIANTSGQRLEHCNVTLTELRDRNGTLGKYPPIRMRLRHDHPPTIGILNHSFKQEFALNPEEHEYINIARLDETKPQSQIILGYATERGTSGFYAREIRRELAPYTLTLAATAEIGSAITKRFSLYVDDEGYLKFAPLRANEAKKQTTNSEVDFS